MEVFYPNPLTLITKPNTYPEKLFIKIFFGSANLQEYYDIYNKSYDKYQNELATAEVLPYIIERYHDSHELKQIYLDWKNQQTGSGKLPTKKQLMKMTNDEIKNMESEILAYLEEESGE